MRAPFLAMLVLAAAPGTASAADVLPDLAQSIPSKLTVGKVENGTGDRFHLGFESVVRNLGAGPLIIDGHRGSTRTSTMTADQLVAQDDGSMRRVRGLGSVRYVDSRTHEHWHLLRFDTYSLRRASDYASVAPDRKTGFCLGDRFDGTGDDRILGEPANPFYTGNCGYNRRKRLTVREGISPGYADNYTPLVEGQYVDVTGVPAGRYLLVHRVNLYGGKLLETRPANNVSSLLIELSWPRGTRSSPKVRSIAGCYASRTCESGAGDTKPVAARAAAPPVGPSRLCTLSASRAP